VIFCLSRICFLVEIPILFHRIREGEIVVKANLALIQDYKTGFASYNGECGDPLNNLDVSSVTTYMNAA
jgi:hypothetical protein